METVRKLHRNEKGLTLIELLAVIVIIGIIAAIAIPSINAIISNSERKAQMTNAHQIIDGARLAISSKGMSAIGTTATITNKPTGSTLTIPAGVTPSWEETDVKLSELIENGFINSALKDPYNKDISYDKDKTLVKVVRAYWTDKGVTTDAFDYLITLEQDANAKNKGKDNKTTLYDAVSEANVDTMGATGVNLK